MCIRDSDRSVSYFPISRGTLPWQSSLGKCHERQLIPLAFFALSFVNELQYHCPNGRANSGDDVAISCKNLVNFCPSTPAKLGLIWERQVRQGQKTGVFRWISPDILDGLFSQYFYHMKALYLQMMDLYPIFQFVKGRCHGNQLKSKNRPTVLSTDIKYCI